MHVSLFFLGDEASGELSRLGQLLSKDQNFVGAIVVVKETTGTREDEGSRTHLIQIYERPSILEPLARALGTWAATCNRDVKVQIRAGTKEIEIDGAQPTDTGEAAARLLGELTVHG